MRISDKKPEGEWASWFERCEAVTAVEDDKKGKVYKTPFPASEKRAMHVAVLSKAGYSIMGPDQRHIERDQDGKIEKDEPDGYKLTVEAPDEPVIITFQRARPSDEIVGVSVLGRKPAGGEALKILPLTDNLAKTLDNVLPPEFRKRKREENIRLEKAQDYNREAVTTLVVGLHGFLDDDGNERPWPDDTTKRALFNSLGSVALGIFVTDRAQELQRERVAGAKVDGPN